MDMSAMSMTGIFARVMQLAKAILFWFVIALGLFIFPDFANSVQQLLLMNVAILLVLVIYIFTTKGGNKKQTAVTLVFAYFAITLASSSTRWLELVIVGSEENMEEFYECRSVLVKKGETHEDAFAKCGLLYSPEKSGG